MNIIARVRTTIMSFAILYAPNVFGAICFSIKHEWSPIIAVNPNTILRTKHMDEQKVHARQRFDL